LFVYQLITLLLHT